MVMVIMTSANYDHKPQYSVNVSIITNIVQSSMSSEKMSP